MIRWYQMDRYPGRGTDTTHGGSMSREGALALERVETG